MTKEKVYLRIKIDLEDDLMSYADGTETENGCGIAIGQYLLDFIYYDFEAGETAGVNRALMLHPYFRYMVREHWPVDKIKKLQEIYKAYFGRLVQGEDMENPVEGADGYQSYLRRYNCIAGMKLLGENGKHQIEYFVSEFDDCLYLEWLEMARRKLHVKRCKSCQRFFVPKKGNIDYCQRIYTDDGRTCTQVGYAQTFARNVKNDELLQAYTRAYKAHYARMTKPRKRAANMTKEEFESWYTQAKNYLALARQGKMDASEYFEWLKK